MADDPAGNNDTHFVQKLEELGWIELQDLIEKLGEPLQRSGLQEVQVQMSKASVISLNERKLFETTAIRVAKILPMTK